MSDGETEGWRRFKRLSFAPPARREVRLEPRRATAAHVSMGRLFCRVLLVLTVGVGLNARASADATQEGTAIDRVWAGHPVGFALLAERGYVFAAYYDAARELTVAARAPGSTRWTKRSLPGRWNAEKNRASNVVGWDSHNGIELIADDQGLLHLSGNLHADPLVYYRTTRPFDITSFERIDRMTGERETRCTYPHFFKNQAGDLLFSYRDGSSGDGSDLYNVFDPATKTWRRHIPTPLFDGGGRRSAYALAPKLGPDGRFHVLWMWRTTPDAATNQSLCYARSGDLRHWEDSQGRPIPLPITFGRGESVDPAAPGGGLINTTYALAFDRAQRPVAIYHRYDAAGHSQLFAARPAGAEWERRPLTDWSFRWAFGGNGSLAVDVYLMAPRSDAAGNLLVPFTARDVPGGVLRIDPRTLAVAGVLPPDPPPLPPERMRATTRPAGMEVRTRTVTRDGIRHVLRWETLPSNRDHPRSESPPPSELRLYEFPEPAPIGG